MNDRGPMGKQILNIKDRSGLNKMSNERDLNTLLLRYADRFKENFPIFYVRNLDDAEIIKLIINALENNKKYSPGMSTLN